MRKSTKKLVSIIVPVYNVEKYLDRCIESITTQTYEYLEIILVDDGSSDHCPKICDNWKEKDNRIKVFHKKNGGVSSARNIGLDNSNGQYITFIDSDDYINKDMIEIMLKEMKDYDICVCDHFIVDDSGIVQKEDSKVEDMESVWQTIYTKDIIGATRFPNYIRSEDRVFNCDIRRKDPKIKFISNKLYNYYQSENSICRNNKYNKQAAIDSIKGTYYVYQYDKKYISILINTITSTIWDLYRDNSTDYKDLKELKKCIIPKLKSIDKKDCNNLKYKFYIKKYDFIQFSLNHYYLTKMIFTLKKKRRIIK